MSAIANRGEFWTEEKGEGRFTHNGYSEYKGYTASCEYMQLQVSVFPSRSNLIKARNAIENAVHSGYLSDPIHIDIVDTDEQEAWGLAEIKNGADRCRRGKEICVYVYFLPGQGSEQKGSYTQTPAQCKALMLKLWEVLQNAGVELSYVTPRIDEQELGDRGFGVLTPFSYRLYTIPQKWKINGDSLYKYNSDSQKWEELEGKNFSGYNYRFEIKHHGVLLDQEYYYDIDRNQRYINVNPYTNEPNFFDKALIIPDNLRAYGILIDPIAISGMRIERQRQYLAQASTYVLGRLKVIYDTYIKVKSADNAQSWEEKKESKEAKRIESKHEEAGRYGVFIAPKLPPEYKASYDYDRKEDCEKKEYAEYKTFFLVNGIAPRPPSQANIKAAINANPSLWGLIRISDVNLLPVFDVEAIAKSISEIEVEGLSSEKLESMRANVQRIIIMCDAEAKELSDNFSGLLDRDLPLMKSIWPRLKKMQDAKEIDISLISDFQSFCPYEMQKLYRTMIHIAKEEIALEREQKRLEGLFRLRVKADFSSPPYQPYKEKWVESLKSMQAKTQVRRALELGSAVAKMAAVPASNSSAAVDMASSSAVAAASAVEVKEGLSAERSNDIILGCAIDLLTDYTKSGGCGRFFTLSWNRHHVDEVQRIIDDYCRGALTKMSELMERLYNIRLSNSNGSLARIITTIVARWDESNRQLQQQSPSVSAGVVLSPSKT
ncbi:MAG: DUF5617 domain-containing protein [Gammaproteobacteria bacterium]|nr:DUF5617 domain-containing protein [Gammaproteobacteria bacterium]